jgi:hypothetical protein
MSNNGLSSTANSRSNSVVDEQLLQQRTTFSRSNSFADASDAAVTAAAVTAAAGATANTEPVTALLLGDLRRDDTHAGCWLLRSQVQTAFTLCTCSHSLDDALMSCAHDDSALEQYCDTYALERARIFVI